MEEAPNVALAVPAGQARHAAAALVAPTTAVAYVPTPQEMQAEKLVPRTEGLYRPTGHQVQEVAPPRLKVPEGHAAQDDAPDVELKPAAHCRQAVAPVDA